MKEKIADLTFGINHQALQVVKLLNKYPLFAEKSDNFYLVHFETKPWYNGRERGIVISMSTELGNSDHNLHISFFEHRNSDDLCCIKWETERMYWNHPLEDKDIFHKAYPTDSKWDVAKSFGYMKYKECADWIYNQFEEFYKNHHKYEGKKK